MNIKSFSIAFLLPMAMGFANVGQAMEGNGEVFNHEQPKTILQLKEQELDIKINEFEKRLIGNQDKNQKKRRLSARNDIPSSIKEIIRSNRFNINNIDNYSSYGEFHQLFKIPPRPNGSIGTRPSLDHPIYSRVIAHGWLSDTDFFKSFVEILKLGKQVKYLEQHPEYGSQTESMINDNELMELVKQQDKDNTPIETNIQLNIHNPNLNSEYIKEITENNDPMNSIDIQEIQYSENNKNIDTIIEDNELKSQENNVTQLSNNKKMLKGKTILRPKPKNKQNFKENLKNGLIEQLSNGIKESGIDTDINKIIEFCNEHPEMASYDGNDESIKSKLEELGVLNYNNIIECMKQITKVNNNKW